MNVFPCVEDHIALLKKVFDFGAIKKLFERKDFSMLYDSMNGVQGPCALPRAAFYLHSRGTPALPCCCS